MRSHRSLNFERSNITRGSSLFLGLIAYCFALTIGILGLAGAIYSASLGKQFDENVTHRLNTPAHNYKPQTCVIMACKGNESGLERNIEAILNQKYERFHIIIVTDSTDDPAYSIANSVLTQNSKNRAQLCTSTQHPGASGKVSALLTALETDGWSSEAYAFIDSDALASNGWLAALIDPLSDESTGATTGFRWYFPPEGGFWSHVEAVWNASGTNLLFDDRYNFPWGGAMAIRRDTLRRINVEEVWENAISDDLSLNSALRKYGYGVTFLPQCCVATYNETDLHGLVSWATRQVTLTKVYFRKLWKYGLAAYAFSNLITSLGFVSIIAGILVSPIWYLPSFIFFIPSLSGVYRSDQRARTFKRAMPQFANEFEKTRLLDAVASLIVPWIMTYCIIKSARINEIEWRGRKYQLTK